MAKRQFSANSLSDAFYLSLNAKPITKEASALGDALLDAFFPASNHSPSRGRPIDRKGIQEMLLAVTADTLKASKVVHGRLVYRSLDRNSFRQGASYRHFKQCTEALVKQGYFSYQKGYFLRTPIRFGENIGVRPGASRWKPKKKFFDLCSHFNITPLNITQTFQWKMPYWEQIQLRSKARWVDGGKQKGERQKLPKNSETEKLIQPVKSLNAYLDLHPISGADHRYFSRIFGGFKVSTPYAWNKGGRLYSLGSENYQQMPSSQRRKLKIDGDATCEIDIKASHLTILYGLLKLKPPKGDPYEVHKIPRDVIKSWFVYAFGKGTIPTKWSRKTSKEFRENIGTKKSLGQLYPIAFVEAQIRQTHGEMIDAWKISGLDSLDLQFLESEAIMHAMLSLCLEQGIPCYPVHDSLIVKKVDRSKAKAALSNAYKEKFGIEPELTVKE